MFQTLLITLLLEVLYHRSLLLQSLMLSLRLLVCIFDLSLELLQLLGPPFLVS